MWFADLPGQSVKKFNRCSLFLEYAAWTMAYSLVLATVAVKAELDYGGDRLLHNPWYPATLFFLYMTVFPLSFILPLLVTTFMRVLWAWLCGICPDQGEQPTSRLSACDPVDGWTWVFCCIMAGVLTGLIHGLVTEFGAGRNRTWLEVLNAGTRGFVLTLLPMATVLVNKLIQVTWRSWRDRARQAVSSPK